MTKIRVGVQIQPQHVLYPEYAAAVRRVEEIGVDTIFNWDHFYPLYGEKDGLHYDGWSILTAMATLTTRAEIGCLVTCNSYRNPNLLADMARTVDHISSGRLILGIGSGWFERDYSEYGYEFGTAGKRLKALERDLPIIQKRWEKLNPLPLRKIPVLVGGGGEKVTLRITAQRADIWNSFGPLDVYKHKNEVLDQWCAEIGRDPKEIERSLTIGVEDLDRLDACVEAGGTHLILMFGAPWNFEAVERLVAWRNKQK